MRMSFAARSISGILMVAGVLVALGMMSIFGLVWSTTTDLQHAMRESGQLTSAMRNHLQSDKAHNALRTTALQAYQAALTDDPAEAETARRDMEKYLDELRAVQERTVDLKLDGETATELRAVQQSYIDYIGSVMEIVALSAGNPEPVGKKMP
jgi:hypothetical protein